MFRMTSMAADLLVVFVVAVTVTSVVSTSLPPCPKDLVQTAQTCFSDLARAVHAGSNPHTKVTDTDAGMTLDYSQIKTYCAKNGHMARFVDCIEGLVSSCEETPQSLLLDRLVSPERVKLAVPTLCAHQNEVEESSDCMNQAMSLASECKAKSYAHIKTRMSASARNATAMFLIQCAFFHSLAECQRKSVSHECGSNLGNLHANFLLSFVPTSCIDGVVTVSSDRTSKPNATSSAAIGTVAGSSEQTKTADDIVAETSGGQSHELENGGKKKLNASSEEMFHVATTTSGDKTDMGNGGLILIYSGIILHRYAQTYPRVILQYKFSPF